MPQWQPHPVGHSSSPRAAAAVTHACTHCQWPPWPHAPHAHATPRTGSAQMEHCSAGCAAACSASPLLEGQACSAPEPAFGLARRASCGPAAAALADAPEEQKPSREPSRPHDVLLGMPPPPPPSRVPEALLAPGPPSPSRGMAPCGKAPAHAVTGGAAAALDASEAWRRVGGSGEAALAARHCCRSPHEVAPPAVPSSVGGTDPPPKAAGDAPRRSETCPCELEHR
mmetsp:Transcript_8958/g.29770  ORF Transcript_8958/g.29770 Transcript_8958/m.29770 type:complete len:227 (-) Transcript_8958:1907-2587(-)